MIKACIFDLGGTIVDRYSLTSLLSLKDAFNNKNIYITNAVMFKNIGKHKYEHIHDIMNDKHISNIWNHMYGKYPGEEEVSNIYNIYNNIQKDRCHSLIDILPETQNIIQYLKGNNIKDGCTTNLN